MKITYIKCQKQSPFSPQPASNIRVPVLVSAGIVSKAPPLPSLVMLLYLIP
jgi:hypothetical protein